MKPHQKLFTTKSYIFIFLKNAHDFAKNGKFQGCHGKFDWKSREVNFQKIDILNRGYNFFLEKRIIIFLKLKLYPVSYTHLTLPTIYSV